MIEYRDDLFCCGFLSVGLGREYLGFVRRCGSNGVSVILGIELDFMACELCGTTIPIRRNTLAL